jgi:hypothetical protein
LRADFGFGRGIANKQAPERAESLTLELEVLCGERVLLSKLKTRS